MTIPALPDAPALGDSPEVFNTKAFAFVAALDDWGTAVNAVAAEVDADATAADADAATATTQAGIATTKASEAAASAVDANSAELGAQAAQTAAELAATNAAASYDSFDDRYLGAKSSDPSVDNDGGALIIGALYFNTTDQKMKVYATLGWKDAGSAVNGSSRRHTFTATAGQTSFTVTDGYDANFADVYLNGVKLVNGTDVTVSSGTAVVLASGAAAGDVLDVVAYGAFEVANTYTQSAADAKFVDVTGDTMTGDLSVASAGTRKVSVNRTNASTAGAIEMISGDSQNVLSSSGAKDIGIEINGSEIVRFKSGGGIKFPGTQLASSDANTLDDYEEGTWTPSLGGNTTYSELAGSYIKVGRIVIASFAVTVNTLGTGSNNQISGLPFTVGGSTYGQGGQIGYYTSLANSVTALYARVDIGQATVQFAASTTAATGLNAGLAVFGNGARVIGSTVYQTS